MRKFLARVLSPEDSRRYDTVPQSWHEPSPIITTPDTPFGSGIGFVSSPFSSYYDKAWGVLPHPDQSKYRVIYRTVPIAATAVDKLVESALAKGYSLDVEDDNPIGERIVEICQSWIDSDPEFDDMLHTAAKDLLVHGTAFIEPCYEHTRFDVINRDDDETRFNDVPLSSLEASDRDRFNDLVADHQELVDSGVFKGFHRFHDIYTGDGSEFVAEHIPSKVYNNPFVYQENKDKSLALLSRGTDTDDDAPSSLLWLKNLDPLTIRVRRDAWGNVYGAIQYLVVPPVAFDTSKIIIGTWNPTSTFYESAYGVSLFQALIRTQEAIWQIENDLLVIGHALAKPPHKFKRGIVDPATGRVTSVVGDTAWSQFQSTMSQRKAGSDLFLPPSVDAEPVNQGLRESISSILQHLDYHHTQRVTKLKVPPQLLGVPEGSTRTTAEVNQEDYVLTVQGLQSAVARMMCKILEAILEPYRDRLGEHYEVPSVVWNPVMEKDENEELKNIVEAYNAGLLTLSEARDMIKKRGIYEIPGSDDEGHEEAIAELEEARRSRVVDASPFGDRGFGYPANKEA